MEIDNINEYDSLKEKTKVLASKYLIGKQLMKIMVTVIFLITYHFPFNILLIIINFHLNFIFLVANWATLQL